MALKLAGLATVGGATLAGAVTSGAAGGGDQTDDGAPQVARLTAPDGEAGDRFGHAIDAARERQRVLVGAPGAPAQQPAGAAYVYDRVDGEWTQTAALSAEDATGAQFGAAVALDASGRTAIVGAPEAEQESGSGVAHVFEHGDGGWTRVTTFTATGTREETAEPPLGSVGGFGSAVALDTDGQTALVGAPYSNRVGAGSGTAYRFARVGGSWTMEGEVRWPGGDSAGLGTDVALGASGDRGVVGVPNNFPGRTGNVGVVEGDGGEFPDTLLTTDDEAELNLLGQCVATDDAGARLLAGAPASGAPDDDGGAIHEFVHDGESWTQAATVAPDDLAAGDACGDAADLDAAGTTALFGAPGQATAAGERAGAAYAYACDGTWTQTAKLLPDDAQAEAAFGAACVLDGAGAFAFVGAPQADTDDGEAAGAVYVFDLEAAGDDSGDHGDEDGGDGKDGEDEGDDGEEDGNDESDGKNGTDDENDGDEDDGNDDGGKNDEDDERDGNGEDDEKNGEDDGGDGDEDDGDASGDVEIAVQPEAPDDPINPRSRDDLSVAILQSDGFDPTDAASGVDVSTIRVGTPDVVGGVGAGAAGSPNERSSSSQSGGASPTHDGHVEDVDGDGDDDLLVHVPTRDVGLEGREATVKLVAETYDGRTVVGTATVDVLHCGL